MGVCLGRCRVLLGVIAAARRREHQERDAEPRDVPGHQADQEAGDSARERGEEDEARGQREDPSGQERAPRPRHRSDDPPVVLEEVPVERQREHHEEQPDGDRLNREGTPEESLVHAAAV